jgi:heme/copper-type cytochrome/quinol oxidase subunit 3
VTLLDTVMLLLCAAGAAWAGHRLGSRRATAAAAVQLVLGMLVLTVLSSLAVLVISMYTFEHVPGEDPVVGLAPFFRAVFFALVGVPLFLAAGVAGFVRRRMIVKRAAAAEGTPDARGRRAAQAAGETQAGVVEQEEE